MEAARAIRLVAAFVIGVVLVMGAAMIYSVVPQMKQSQAAVTPKPVPTRQTSPAVAAVQTTATQVSVPSPTLVHVPVLPSSSASVAYVRVPDPAITNTRVSEPHKAAISVPAPAPPEVSNPATNNGELNQIASNQLSEQPPLMVRPETSESAPAPAMQPSHTSQPHTVTLWSGTPVTVRLAQPLSTDQTKTGDYFHATLEAPIIQDGFVIADVGSGATGQVIRSRRGGMFGRAPDLTLDLVQIRTTDNQVIRVLTTSWSDMGHSHNPVSGTFRSAVGAVSGALTGAAHGSGLVSEPSGDTGVGKDRNLALPPNTVVQFRLAAPVSLTEHTH